MVGVVKINCIFEGGKKSESGFTELLNLRIRKDKK